MAVAHTNALELLGKTVSFVYLYQVQLTEHSSIDFREEVSGVVTSIVLSINHEPEISVGDGDFYSLDDIQMK